MARVGVSLSVCETIWVNDLIGHLCRVPIRLHRWELCDGRARVMVRVRGRVRASRFKA